MKMTQERLQHIRTAAVISQRRDIPYQGIADDVIDLLALIDKQERELNVANALNAKLARALSSNRGEGEE